MRIDLVPILISNGDDKIRFEGGPHAAKGRSMTAASAIRHPGKLIWLSERIVGHER